MKKLLFTRRNPSRHWVGDGFPVRSVFSYNDIAQAMSPFLLLDHAGPARFEPTTQRRGVGEHPHRGFETVTIVYDGDVEHRDSTGAGGTIGPGDVQWMTAGAGIVHQEFHGSDYAQRGGPFEMLQLWVNLPARDKMTPAGYQAIANAQIPRAALPDGAGTLRVIAGAYGGHLGPARTFSPMNVWDLRLNAGHGVEFSAVPGHTVALYVMKGALRLVGGENVAESDLAVLERDGDRFAVEATADATVLVLTGEPTNEPIVGHGPFVMNTPAEIRQAFVDYQSGRMGRVATPA